MAPSMPPPDSTSCHQVHGPGFPGCGSSPAQQCSAQQQARKFSTETDVVSAYEIHKFQSSNHARWVVHLPPSEVPALSNLFSQNRDVHRCLETLNGALRWNRTRQRSDDPSFFHINWDGFEHSL